MQRALRIRRTHAMRRRVYNGSVKVLVFLLLVAGMVFAQDREANYTLRFEPTAELQTNVEVPFQIRVIDDLKKPVGQAKVTLQIETPDHDRVQVFKAPGTDPGVYIAKPVFPVAGEWNVYVEVRKDGMMSARTIQFSVPVSPFTK
jgi:hypothetical protein